MFNSRASAPQAMISKRGPTGRNDGLFGKMDIRPGR